MKLDYLSKALNYNIVKSNKIIQEARYPFTIQEQRALAYIISKIKPEDRLDDPDQKLFYEFKISEFCDVFGLEKDSGSNYAGVREAIRKLSERVVIIPLDEDNPNSEKEISARWIDRFILDKKSDTVHISFDYLMAPYLFQLKNHFTQYKFGYIVNFRSQFSFRLYELLKSYQNLEEYTFDIEELKQIVDVKKYRFVDFRRFVLEVAVKEINEYTDIFVEYHLIKNGRKYEKITFTISKNEDPALLDPLNIMDTLAETQKENKRNLFNEVYGELHKTKALPYHYRNDIDRMTEAIHILTNWDQIYNTKHFKSEADYHLYLLANQALIDMCMSDEKMKLNKSVVTYNKIIDKINEVLQESGSLDILMDIIEPAMDDYKSAVTIGDIKNGLAYMKACLWSVMQVRNLNIFGALVRDGYSYEV